MNLIIRFGLAVILAVCSGAAFSQGAQEEVDKQVTKLIGDAISSRISSEVVRESGSAMPVERNNIWGSYSRIGVDFDSGTTSVSPRTNVYIVGYDRDITKDLVLGVSLDRTRTNMNDATSTGISPYLAYKFTKSFFAIATYNHTEFDLSHGDDGHSNTFGGSLNFVERFGDFLFKGRGGISRVKSQFDFAGSTTKSSATNFLGDAEAGYFFASDLYGFAGVQLGTSNHSDTYAAYARLGMEKKFNKTSYLSLKYERKFDDNLPSGTDLKVRIWTLAGRISF